MCVKSDAHRKDISQTAYTHIRTSEKEKQSMAILLEIFQRKRNCIRNRTYNCGFKIIFACAYIIFQVNIQLNSLDLFSRQYIINARNARCTAHIQICISYSAIPTYIHT